MKPLNSHSTIFKNTIQSPNIVTQRSKSTASFSKIKAQLQSANKDKPKIDIKRVQSAIKLKNQHKIQTTDINNRLTILPKMNKGKLHLGKLAKPNYILPYEIRNNPWSQPKPISQEIITKKGLIQVINMGLVPKTADFTELLNTKYEIQKKARYYEDIQDNPLEIFATNPMLGTVEPKQQKNELSQKKSEKIKKKKVKKISASKLHKQDDFKINFVQKKIVLQIVNSQILNNEQYKNQFKLSKMEGYQIFFKQYIKKVEEFSRKFKLKKFSFYFELDQTKKVSDFMICRRIINYKVLGIYQALVGGRKVKAEQNARMILYKFRYRKARRDLEKIQNIKKFYRVKKYYQLMMKKRLDLLKYKFGSYIQNQRRYLQEINAGEYTKTPLKYRTQIHIPLLNTMDLSHKNSFYKLQQRNNIQLTRLFNNAPQHLIMLTKKSRQNQEIDFTPWTKILDEFNGYHPMISIITCDVGKEFKSNINSYDEIYYGLNSKCIKQIKRIFSYDKKKKLYGQLGLIPSSFPNSMVKLAQMFDISLCGGNFLEKNIQQMKKEEENQQNNEQIQQNNPNIPSSQSKDDIAYIRQKSQQINSFELINNFLNKKFMIKKILTQFNFETPFCLFYEPSVQDKQKNFQQFLYRFSEAIIEKKPINFWMIKLKNQSRFSRGLAMLEISSLKIVKEKKKKSSISAIDIEQLANLIKQIMSDKLIIPQNSLHDRNQFIANFFDNGGYIQQYYQNVQSCCLFGNLLPGGEYEHLGTYNKIYTDELVNCAAVYPSSLITLKQIQTIEALSKILYDNYGLYGKITFELIYEKANSKFFLIDFVPFLQQYSSFYYMYSKYFGTTQSQYEKINVIKSFKKSSSQSFKKSINQSRNLKSQNKIKNQIINLKRNILYCPFIDNNGNKFMSFGEFEEAVENYKIKTLNYSSLEGVQYLYLNLSQKIPDALSIIAMGSTEKKVFKYCLDGLNFLTQTGDKANKFDKKVKRQKYDNIFINDIIWKLREIKKKLDHQEILQQTQKY